ncbi:outer membrane usher protein FimD [Acinetobacter stercoris]|uniref:Outer membrane usher protein FimD n=1 Tax=Acinetobacter stercoris TaxID=2126983 RepID=A0A2U3N0W1_9GAMM|nr:outer membrane usher protein FimD [Acinetobacter stercoris]SPL71302.1 Outer membrane usher protein FimD precursor [Acinetobacter stercoris]
MSTRFVMPSNTLRIRKNIRLVPYGLAVTLLISMAVTRVTHAEQVFNPAFLKDDLSHSQISDLTRFEKSTHQLPGIYRVDIYVNDQYILTRDVNFIEKTDIKDRTGLLPCLDSKTLQSFGVNMGQYQALSDPNQQCIDFISIIEGANSQFQFDKQKLHISLPQASLRNQIRGYIPPDQWDSGINGMFVNYNLSGYNNSKTDTDSVFLRLDNGLNLGSWQFRHSSSWNHNSRHGKSSNDWNNLNTYLQKTIIPLKSQLIVGDGSSNSEVFDSFGFRGVHLSTADAMYPDSQQGYAPTVRGVAKTNAKVVIKQNGYVIHQINVAPGPFLIQDLNPTSISGDLLVTIEENDGSVQSFTVPYSSLPIFQREGRTKYSIIAGEYRSGLDSQDSPTVVQATAIHGLQKGFSVYAGTQLSDKYKSALLGMGANLGTYGALSFDLTHADSELADQSSHSGQSLRFLYSKSLLSSGTTFQLLGYRYSTKGFYTLNDVAYNRMSGYHTSHTQDGNQANTPIITDYFDLYNSKKGRFEVNISHSLGKYGSLFVSGNQQTYWGTNKRNEWVQAGYANSWKALNYSFSISHNKLSQLTESETMYAMNLSFPLDKLWPKSNFTDSPIKNAYTTFSTTQNSNGNESYLAGLSGTLLKDRNLSYSFNQGRVSRQGDIGSVTLNYDGRYGTVGAGYSYEKNSNQFTYNASGGILAHRDGITFGQPLGATSILIKAPGAKNVNIENYTGVRTDWRGYAIVPYATEYRANRIALNSNTFSNNLEINNNVENVVPIKGAISRATFNTSIGVRALITLSHLGKFAPYASSVVESNSSARGIVADDGRTYLTGLPVKGNLEVRWGVSEDEKCLASYDISEMDLTQPIVQFDLECK